VSICTQRLYALKDAEGAFTTGKMTCSFHARGHTHKHSWCGLPGQVLAELQELCASRTGDGLAAGGAVGNQRLVRATNGVVSSALTC